MKAPYRITGLVILVACSDGKFREVSLAPAAAITLRHTLKHVSHGTIKLFQTALRIEPEDGPAVRWLTRKWRACQALFCRKAPQPPTGGLQ